MLSEGAGIDWITLVDVVLEESNATTMISFTMSEDDVKRFMADPHGTVWYRRDSSGEASP